MKRLALALLLALFAPLSWAADAYTPHSEGSKGVARDSRGFKCFVKQTPPTIDIDENSDYGPEHISRDYIACGDPLVTGSPVYGAIAPTWSLTGTPPATSDLDDDDLGDVTYSITDAVEGTYAAFNIVGDNSAGTATTVARSATVNDTGGGGVGPESIAQGQRSFFVCPNSPLGDTGAGNTLATRWSTLDKLVIGPAGGWLAGDDIYLCGGSTFTITNTSGWQMLTPGGVDPVTNRAIFGSYYTDGAGNAFVNSPTNYTVSRLPSTYTYASPRPIIRGSYLPACRVTQYSTAVQINSTGAYVLGSAPMQKCAWQSGVFSAGVRGNFGVGGTHAVPSKEGTALISFAFTSGKKWLTVQDLELTGSAGRVIGLSMEPVVTCMNGFSGSVDCKIESILQRIYSHNNARQTNLPYGVARVVLREFYVHETNLSYADLLTGAQRAGPQFIPFNCSPCELLVENNEARDTYSEIFAAYLTTGMLARGNIGVNHSMSQGTASDMIYEQNILYGSDHPLSPPTGNPDTIFPFWGIASDNGGGEQGGPQWYSFAGGATGSGPANTQVLRRNNFAVGYVTNPLFGYAVTKPTHPSDNRPPFAWIHSTGWDIGNTVVSGGQSSGVLWKFRAMTSFAACEEGSEVNADQPGVIAANGTQAGVTTSGCRPNPRSFLNTWKVKDNAFIVQSGYVSPLAPTWCSVENGSLGTITLSNNFFNVTSPPTSCVGTNDVTTTTTGLPSYDWLSDGRSMTDVMEFDIENLRPSASSAMISGAPLLTNDGAIDQSGIWTWVLSQRKWLPECNTDGMMSEADWYKQLARDYCENIRDPVTPTIGALEHD